MHISEVESFKAWLTKNLASVCEADPVALSKYIVALIQKNKPLDELKTNCCDQLRVFLNEGTQPFVEEVFDVLQTGTYITHAQKEQEENLSDGSRHTSGLSPSMPSDRIKAFDAEKGEPFENTFEKAMDVEISNDRRKDDVYDEKPKNRITNRFDEHNEKNVEYFTEEYLTNKERGGRYERRSKERIKFSGESGARNQERHQSKSPIDEDQEDWDNDRRKPSEHARIMKPSNKPCYEFQARGFCSKKDSCPYRHLRRSDRRTGRGVMIGNMPMIPTGEIIRSIVKDEVFAQMFEQNKMAFSLGAVGGAIDPTQIQGRKRKSIQKEPNYGNFLYIFINQILTE